MSTKKHYSKIFDLRHFFYLGGTTLQRGGESGSDRRKMRSILKLLENSASKNHYTGFANWSKEDPSPLSSPLSDSPPYNPPSVKKKSLSLTRALRTHSVRVCVGGKNFLLTFYQKI